MLSLFERKVALRYLLAKKRESFIWVVSTFSLIGIALGVAALIVVMSVMNGFRNELSSKIIGFDGDILVSSSTNIGQYDDLISIIKTTPNIIYAAPVVEKRVLLSYGPDTTGVQVRGMKPEDLQQKQIIAKNIIAGKLEDIHSGKILIGSELARSFFLTIGHRVKLIAPQASTTILGNIPKFKTYEIAGIFKTGMSEYDRSSVYLSLSDAQALFGLNNKVSQIEILSNNPLESEQTSVIIAKLLAAEKVKVQDWQSRNSALFYALKTERVAMFVILTLIIIVAAFNIISGLVMLVQDKTYDIAILKTIGATDGMIMRIFLTCGLSLGILGTISGVILGVAFASNIETIRQFLQSITSTNLFDPLVYYLSFLPVDVQLGNIVSIALLSLVLSFLATLYPAYRTTKLQAIEALRYR